MGNRICAIYMEAECSVIAILVKAVDDDTTSARREQLQLNYQTLDADASWLSHRPAGWPIDALFQFSYSLIQPPVLTRAGIFFE